jgi:branched-chain amino acid transport system ATP-binding protein
VPELIGDQMSDGRLTSSSAGTPALLEVAGLSIRFGGLQALADINLTIGATEILGVIGPNGAGKSTLINCLTRLYTPDRTSILRFEDRNLLRLRPHQVPGAGISRTFQGLELFGTMTVGETLLVGQQSRFRTPAAAVAVGWPASVREERRLELAAQDLVELFELDRFADRIVSTLPYGVQKRVDLARALACRPRLLLLDEPAAGLNDGEVAQLRELILEIRRQFGIAMLLVEHHVGLVREVADNVCVLDFGRTIAYGPPEQTYLDPVVIEAYLGAPEDDDA